MKKGLFRAFLMLCMLFVLTGTALAHDNHPVCGTSCSHDSEHEAITDWTAWSSSTSLPSTEGNYYLTKDVTISTTWKPVDGTVLCLNGYSITWKSKPSTGRGIQVEAGRTFTLTDCGTDEWYGCWDSDKKTYTKTQKKPEDGTDFDTFTGGCVDGSSVVYYGVYLEGTFNMYGGTITRIPFGFGVSLNTDSTAFHMYGGAIAGNYVGYGSVYVANGTFTMSGGAITDNVGRVDYRSGGVYLSSGTFIMTGGEITKNTMTAKGGGGVYVNSGSFQVSGTPTITGNTKADGTTNNVYLYSSSTINITGEMSSTAKIGVTMSDVGTFTNGWSTYNSTTPTSVFFSDNSSSYAVTKNSSGELQLTSHNFDTTTGVSTATGYHKHDVGGTSTVFTPWTKTDELPTESGSYVLTDDVTLDATWEVQANITLDLNGHDITLEEEKTGSVIQVNSGKIFTLYDCNSRNITRYGYGNGKSYTVVKETGDVPQGTTSDTLTGGIISGGNSSDQYKGGGVNVNGTFNMYGGNIAGNNARYYGGGVYLSDWNTFNMYGGSVAGNYADQGGGVAANRQSSTFAMSGGKITNNQASGDGGGVYIYSNGGTFTMSDGEITGNTAGSDGGGVFVGQATFTMSGGKISDNTATGTDKAGGVATNGGATFTMSGGEISDNAATGSNGIGGVRAYGTFQVSGTAKITGNTQGSGESKTDSNLYLSSNKTITIAAALDPSARIGVTMKTPSTFTAGWDTYNGSMEASVYTTIFTSDNSSYLVRKNSSNELELHVHTWGAWTTTKEATCTESGSKYRTCSVCGTTETAEISALDHDYTYSASGAELTKSCSRSAACGYTAQTATISAPTSLTYDGSAKTATVTYSDNWTGSQDLTISYSSGGNVNAGSVTASITAGTATASVTYTIAAASQNAPAATVVSIDYTTETITFGDTYEVNTQADFGGNSLASGGSITPGSTIYVRAKAYQNHSASEATAVTVSQRPAAPSVTSGDESIQGKSDGTITGVTAAMEYKKSSDNGWTAIAGTTIENLASGTYSVRYKATDSTFASEAATVTVSAGSTLTVTFNANGGSNVDAASGLSYNATVSTPNTPTKTGYTFGGWFQEESLTTAWNFATNTVTADTTLYAKWTLNNPTATGTGYTGTYDGSSHNISVSASHEAGEGAELTYQWSKDGSPIAGATSATYAVKSVADSGTYSCVVTATDGNSQTKDFTVSNITVSVTKAALTVTAEDKTATYGDAAPTYTVSYSGFQNNETTAVLGGTLGFTCTYAQYSSQGSYAITPSGLTADNYNITFTDGTLTVSPKAITVTIEEKSSVYGAAIEDLTATDDGIVNGDTNVYSLSTTATSTSNVGSYDITGEAGSNTNYTVTFANETDAYTITAASQEIPGDDAFTIDFTNETIAFGSDYEVSTSDIFTENTLIVSGATIEPDKQLYIRRKAIPNYNPSGALTISLGARPAAPTNLSATSETVKGQGNGTITGVDSTMEYQKTGTSGWTAITGTTVTNLTSGTYYVRYQATDSTFASEAAAVTVSEGSTLTVTFNANGGSTVAAVENLSYHATVTLPTTTRTGYSFGGWYNGNTKLTETTQITESATYTAQWTLDAPTVTTGESYTGTYDEASHTISISASHEASGVTFSYQWYKDDAAIAGATGDSYTVANAADSGTYYCKVTASDNTLSSTANSGAITVSITPKEVSLPDRSGVVLGQNEVSMVRIDGFSTVPENLVNNESLNTVEKIQTTLTALLQTGVTSGEVQGNQVTYDVTLMISEDGGTTWKPATADNFPENGRLTVLLPYPAGTDSSYSFTAVHMFTTSDFGKTPGDTETLRPIKTENGIQVTVTGLSPIAVAWTEPQQTTIPTIPTVTSHTIQVGSAENGTVQADRTGAIPGATVTLTVTPDEGYVLKTLTVKDSSGKELTLTKTDEGKYTFTMPSSKVTVSVEFAPISTDHNCPAEALTDVNTEKWYHTALDYVLEHGIMEGYGDGTFGPGKTLTRAQLAQILYNIQDDPQITIENPFTDVDENQWYAKAVIWAYQEGIVEGYGDGRFGPNHEITRQDLAVMLWRYAGKPEATQTSLDFQDANLVSGYAQAALLWANEAGIVQGDNGILNPKGNANRAEAAAMIMRYLELE